MHDMPPTVVKAYRRWIKHFPESFSQTDMDLFYMFAKQLIHTMKKDRSPQWLESNMKEDRPDLAQKVIEKYGELYMYLKDFDTVHKRHTFKMVSQSEFEEMRKRWLQK